VASSGIHASVPATANNNNNTSNNNSNSNNNSKNNNRNTEITDYTGNNTDKRNSAVHLIRVVSVYP